jgi:hypothetical protein
VPTAAQEELALVILERKGFFYAQENLLISNDPAVPRSPRTEDLFDDGRDWMRADFRSEFPWIADLNGNPQTD